jgi:hydrogenase maturation protein HypF
VSTWHIHIKGQIQGVGFRPFIFRLANLENLKGWVSNAIDGVHIEINANQKTTHLFLEKIISQAPSLAQITASSITAVEEKQFTDFSIIESTKEGIANLLLSPDFGMCTDCQKELITTKNRRSKYPFITCTNCGPRYSIIQQLPYDRVTTTMQNFEMCGNCLEEYHSPTDRRYFSQTTSCPNCAIQLSLFDNNRITISKNPFEIIEKISQLWSEGEIIAIKGIGGYLLTCDANNKKVIQKLRQLKHRPTKPFALIFPNLEMVKKEVEISKMESMELKSVVAPIVILNLKNTTATNLQLEVIAPHLNQIGVMLPYTPLFDLLLEKFKKPIVATSGNISNAPIIFEDKKAFVELSTIADFTLTNNRQIVVPQDDSVIRFSYFKKQKIIIRRSRGLAPTYINSHLDFSNQTILSTGAILKSTFTFLHQGNIFISQYLGNLENFDTTKNYQFTIQHFFNLFRSEPEVIICDAHPDYPSTQFAEQLAASSNLPLLKVQHHIAHFAAVMGEHNLIQSSESILGVIWDGTGLGDDGNIWGGEFFIFKNHQFKRCGHLSYFDFILGNKMPKEPRISALILSKNIPDALNFLKEKFTETEWNIYNKIIAKDNTLKSSSIGRLFDAVAALLNLCDKQSFEGEAAMLLENLALDFFKINGLDFQSSYFSKLTSQQTISTDEILAGILEDIQQNKPTNFIAAKFHFSLIQSVEAFAEKININKLAFSGGVFQNGILVDLLIHHLGKNYELYFHQDLSPNDENISFGQLIYYNIQQDSADKSLP